MTSALGFFESAASIPHAIVDPSFLLIFFGSLVLSYLATENSDLHTLTILSSNLMLIADLILGLTLMYAMIAHATWLEAPNFTYEAGAALLSILIILPRTPATCDISTAFTRA